MEEVDLTAPPGRDVLKSELAPAAEAKQHEELAIVDLSTPDSPEEVVTTNSGLNSGISTTTLATQPTTQTEWEAKSKAAEDRGDYREALRCLTEQLAIAPSASLLDKRSEIHFFLKDFTAALADAKQCNLLYPSRVCAVWLLTSDWTELALFVACYQGHARITIALVGLNRPEEAKAMCQKGTLLC